MGDFNNVFQTRDRLGDNKVTEAEVLDLNTMMDDLDLSEKYSCGDHFTWFNKHSKDPIYSRIDRVIPSMEWHTKNIITVLHIKVARYQNIRY